MRTLSVGSPSGNGEGAAVRVVTKATTATAGRSRHGPDRNFLARKLGLKQN